MPKLLHNQGLAIALFVGAASGCGAPPPPTVPAEPPPSTAQPAVPEVDAATTPVESTTQPLQVDPGPSPLHIAGEHASAFALFGLGDIGFVRVDAKLLEVRDDRVSYDRSPNRGLPSGNAYEDFVLAGEWPDTAFIVATRTDQNRRRTELFFWDGHRWKSKLQTQKSTVIRALAPWNLRRVLALMQNTEDGSPSFEVVAGFPIHPVPRPTASDAEGCKTKIRLEKAAILRSGHVFAVGPFCGDKSRTVGMERWEPGKTQGEISSLPESLGVDVAGIAAIDGSNVVVAGSSQHAPQSAYVASFDGATWKRHDTPMGSGVAELVAGPEGTLWAVTRAGELWKQPQRGSWTRVPMPPRPGGNERIDAVSLWPRAAEDAWVVGRYQADGKARTVLLHTRPHEGPVPFDGRDE